MRVTPMSSSWPRWTLPSVGSRLRGMSSNAERLAAAVLARRSELDLTQMDVWQNGGPSNSTLTLVEGGQMATLSRTTARKLDIGMEWEPGSAMRLWKGEGEPTPLVSGRNQDDGYVASPGPRVEPSISNADVLAELRAMREEQRAMSERLARLEEGSKPLGGAGSTP